MFWSYFTIFREFRDDFLRQFSLQTALGHPAVQHWDVGDDYKQVDSDNKNDDHDDI